MSGRGYFSNGVDAAHLYLAAVGAGKVPGVTYANVNARKTNLSISGKTPLIDFAAAYVFPSDSGEVLTAVSNNAADVGNVLEIKGLDENFKLQRELFVTNGLTPVAIPGTWTRVNEVNGVAVTFIGEVAVSGANTYAVAYPDTQQSSLGVYSSPVGYLAHILTVVPSIAKVSGGASSAVSGRLKLRPIFTGSTFRVPFEYGLQTNGLNTVHLTNTIPQGLPGPFDIVHEAEATAASTELYVRMAVLLQEV